MKKLITLTVLVSLTFIPSEKPKPDFKTSFDSCTPWNENNCRMCVAGCAPTCFPYVECKGDVKEDTTP